MSELTELVNAEVEKRLSDPKFLRGALIEANERIDEQDKQIKEMKPAKEFYDLVTNTDNWMEMAAVAKLIDKKGYGRNNLFVFLKEQEVLRPSNEPYQKYVDRGYFKMIEQAIPLESGEIIINRKTVVSQKGVAFIGKLIEAEINE